MPPDFHQMPPDFHQKPSYIHQTSSDIHQKPSNIHQKKVPRLLQRTLWSLQPNQWHGHTPSTERQARSFRHTNGADRRGRYVSRGLSCTSATIYHGSDGSIELIRPHELFDGEMHPVPPIVTRIGRNIDTLGVLIGQPQTLIGGEPILQRQ